MGGRLQLELVECRMLVIARAPAEISRGLTGIGFHLLRQSIDIDARDRFVGGNNPKHDSPRCGRSTVTDVATCTIRPLNRDTVMRSCTCGVALSPSLSVLPRTRCREAYYFRNRSNELAIGVVRTRRRPTCLFCCQTPTKGCDWWVQCFCPVRPKRAQMQTPINRSTVVPRASCRLACTMLTGVLMAVGS
jgi:hypothetical protein